MEIRKSETVGTVVTRNIETATVFNYYGVDFYSKGSRTLEEVCMDENVPIVSLLDDLSQSVELSQGSPDFMRMKLRDLSIYIVRRHHRFAEKKTVFIKHALTNIIGEWENSREILMPLKNEFDDFSAHLTLHMNHEEFLVFPFIEKMVGGRAITPSEYRLITKPFASFKEECKQKIIRLREVTRATRDFVIRGGSDNIYSVGYDAMMELEEDLKIHMHLENNILFPRFFDFAERNNIGLN